MGASGCAAMDDPTPRLMQRAVLVGSDGRAQMTWQGGDVDDLLELLREIKESIDKASDHLGNISQKLDSVDGVYGFKDVVDAVGELQGSSFVDLTDLRDVLQEIEQKE